MTLTIPLKLPSVSNVWEHWRSRSTRNKAQRAAVKAAWRCHSKREERHVLECWQHEGLPLVVTLTRIAPRPIRDTFENLPMCFKAVVDQVAEELGVDDSTLDIAKPKQERGPYAVRIEIKPAENLLRMAGR